MWSSVYIRYLNLALHSYGIRANRITGLWLAQPQSSGRNRSNLEMMMNSIKIVTHVELCGRCSGSSEGAVVMVVVELSSIQNRGHGCGIKAG